MNASRAASAETTRRRVAQFRQDVIDGLSADPRSLPSKYFYDRQGSQLFDQICELDEYYPSRTETQIMADSVEEIADKLGPRIRLIEYGSGSSIKTRLLLEHLDQPVAYLPVDVSEQHLRETADRLAEEYPAVEIMPVAADFTGPFQVPVPPKPAARTCVFFPGSTIGNFKPSKARDLLASIGEKCGTAGALLIGIDLLKDLAILHAAYNDREQVTAAFNKNILLRINHELGADFDLDQFEHLAFYDQDKQRIEMHLRSTDEQIVSINGHRFEFAIGDTIRTELSHKYTIREFSELAAGAGWQVQQVWTDPQQYFAVILLEFELP